MEQTTLVKKRYGKTAIHDSQHKEVLFFASRTSHHEGKTKRATSPQRFIKFLTLKP